MQENTNIFFWVRVSLVLINFENTSILLLPQITCHTLQNTVPRLWKSPMWEGHSCLFLGQFSTSLRLEERHTLIPCWHGQYPKCYDIHLGQRKQRAQIWTRQTRDSSLRPSQGRNLLHQEPTSYSDGRLPLYLLHKWFHYVEAPVTLGQRPAGPTTKTTIRKWNSCQ